MFIYGLMKYVEKAASRYDSLMNHISFGYYEKAKNYALKDLKAGSKVLDVGCGTGNYSIEAAKKGAKVTSVDPSMQMLSVFKKKIEGLEQKQNIEILESGAASLDTYIKASDYDYVIFSMILGELSAQHKKRALALAHSFLKEDGKIIVVDELWPKGFFGNLLYSVLFFAFFIPNFLATRTVIKPVKNLNKFMSESGFVHLKTMKMFFGVISCMEFKKGALE